MNKSKVLPILITFDTDSDDFQNQKFNDKTLSWKGISEGVLQIKSAFSNVLDSFGNTPKITWFVRADNVIHDTYESSNYLLKKYEKIWEICKKSGDEIAWHPHLHKQNNQDKWVQETNPKIIKKIIKFTYENFKEINFIPKSVRVGGTFGSNELNKIFNKLNIKCNSSSFPGRMFDFDNYKLSWLNSPKSAYFPDINNYSQSGTNNYKTLQVPLTVLPIKTCYDKDFYLRYLDLTFKHSLIKNSFSKIIPEIDFVVSISHPNIILDELKGIKHGLLCFDIKNLYNNLIFIIEECKKHNLLINFMTMNQFYEQYSKQ